MHFVHTFKSCTFSAPQKNILGTRHQNINVLLHAKNLIVQTILSTETYLNYSLINITLLIYLVLYHHAFSIHDCLFSYFICRDSCLLKKLGKIQMYTEQDLSVLTIKRLLPLFQFSDVTKLFQYFSKNLPVLYTYTHEKPRTKCWQSMSRNDIQDVYQYHTIPILWDEFSEQTLAVRLKI